MKQLILSYILLTVFISCKNVAPQRPTPYVDERIELLNIVFRLANNPNYQNGIIKPYTEAVDKYFAAYKEHELIKFAEQLSNKYHLSHDAVAKYAVMLDINKEKISFIKDGILELGPRWQGDAPVQFLEKLNDFYAASNFHQFFKNNTGLYQEAVERYNKRYVDTDFNWFNHYFGGRPDDKDFKVVLNLLEKDWSFGPKVKFTNSPQEIAYAIVCTSDADSSGLPQFDDWSYHVVVHELIHSYANPLIDKYASKLDSINHVFYNYSANPLRQHAVGHAKQFLYETLVRAGEIQYHKANSDPLLWRKRLHLESISGFLWLETLCNLLTDEYEPNRAKYPDMDSFMPRIVEVLNNLFPDELSKAFMSKAIKVTGSSIQNGDTHVDPATQKLVISFDKAMATGENSFGIRPGKYGKKAVPEVSEISWSPDAKQLILDIHLEPDRTYSLLFPNKFFMSTHYEPIAESYHLEFKTSKL